MEKRNEKEEDGVFWETGWRNMSVVVMSLSQHTSRYDSALL